MKIQVKFTLDVPAASMAALHELSCCQDRDGVSDFVRTEAKQYVADYLYSNGVNGVSYVEHLAGGVRHESREEV